MATWKLEEIEKLFTILGEDDVEKQLGVTLTDSFLMIPKKSICGVMAQTKGEFISCQVCTMKCEYRSIHYQESKEQRLHI